MPKPLPQFDLNPAKVRPYGLSAADLVPRRPSIDAVAQGAELRRLVGTTIDENTNLIARVRELEAELRRRSEDLIRLRRELRGAVRDAMTDPLTGLANRRSFDLELAAAAARANGSAPAQLVLVDVDHFKPLNDAHGHAIGDEVLRIVGEILLAHVRRDSLIARLGGDEFGLLLPSANRRYAAGIASRLCELLASRPLVVRGHPEVIERVTLSIGVAGCLAGEPAPRWYARADAALYEAKRAGRNRVSVA